MALLRTALLAAALLAAPVPAADGEQAVVDASVSSAADAGITQSVVVLDRSTGAQVAGSGADLPFISESIVKLFTVAYYEVQADGSPPAALAEQLRTMIEQSDDDIESELWSTDIVPSMAKRYGLQHTSNGPKTGPHDWGWETITAGDEAKFLYEMSTDPEVGPLLMDAMANVTATGSDGFDQEYGLNALPGDHGSKQGWTDVGEVADRVQIHSVGWTEQYFVAILQTSSTATDDVMKMAATDTAQAIAAAESASTPGDAASSEPGTGQAAPPPVAAAADPAGAEAAKQIDGVLAGLREKVLVILGRVTGASG